jgi:hypothetical protein
VRRFLVVVLVLVALVAAGDRAAAALATHEAERRLTGQGFVHPEVELSGFPFLTQLLGRHFPQMSVTAERLQNGQAEARTVRADLHDVRVPHSGPVRIRSLTATGTIPYAVVTRALGVASLHLTLAGDGQLSVSRSVPVLGQDLDVTARARVSVRGNRISLVPTGVQLAQRGPLSAEVSRLVADRIAFEYLIPGLPAGILLESVTPTADGFRVRLIGRDVSAALP